MQKLVVYFVGGMPEAVQSFAENEEERLVNLPLYAIEQIANL